MEIENNQNQGNLNHHRHQRHGSDENPIPLPPRDRSKTLQPKSSLTRHQRKHPLIIPGGGVTRALAKMQAASSPTGLEDQVDGFQQRGFGDGEREDMGGGSGGRSGMEDEPESIMASR